MNLNFHMPMLVDLSYPLVLLTGQKGSGKSTLLHSIYYALREEKVNDYVNKNIVPTDLPAPGQSMIN